MQAATFQQGPDTSGPDRLLTDIKQKPLGEHALRQHAVLAFGRRTNAQPPLAILMQDAAALVGEVLHAEFGGVGEVQGETLVLSVHALDRNGSAILAKEHRCPANETSSMAAFALRSGSATVSADLGKETRFRDGFLRSLNVTAALTVPLHVNAKPFGVLAVYARGRREFSLDDVAFAETISHLLSASVARINAEQKLREVGELNSSLLGMVDSMVMTLDAEGRVVDMNRACEELTQYQITDVRDRPFWQAMVAPDDADLIKLIFQSSRGSQIPSEFEGEVVARDGTRRRVSWSLKVLSTGQVQSILVTGRDQTAQAEIEAELQRVRTLTEETTATLNQLSARLEKKRATGKIPAVPPPLDDGGVPMPPTESEMAAVAENASGQRRSARRAYRYRQSIAATTGDRFPPPGAFFEVDCWDISACGFSFFMDQLPKFDTLLAALGRAPSLNHFSARVMRVARMRQGEKTRYLVGCDFIDRVQFPKTKA
jgi:PAS domain S-box-containing protein